MKKAIVIAGLVVGVLVAGPAWADRVTLTNKVNQKLSFNLRCLDNNGAWSQKSIEAGASMWYNFDGCKKYSIALSTTHKAGDKDTVQYNLQALERYDLIFDQKKQVFDVKKSAN